MELLRKSLKAYVIAVISFTVLTFALAALISFTGFKEEWAFGGLIVSLTLSGTMLGFMEGKIVGKRGLITGALSSALFLTLIILSAGGIFTGSLDIADLSAAYLIPLAGGAVGGIIGVSGENS